MTTNSKRRPRLRVPIWRSLIDCEALGDVAAEIFGLEPGSCVLVQQGVNDTYHYQADDGRSWFLRLSRHGERQRRHLNSEAQSLVALARAGCEVCAPVSDAAGTFVHTVAAPEGDRHLMVFPAAPGRIAERPDGDRYRHLGRVLGRLHDAADRIGRLPKRPALDECLLLEAPVAALQEFFPRHRYLDSILHHAEQCRQALTDLPRNDRGWGFIHGDLHTGNCCFTDDGQATLFDFDNCGPGWRLYDLAVFFFTRRSVHELESDRMQAWCCFIEGYRMYRYIEDEEFARIPWMIMLRQFWQAGFALARRKERGEHHIADLPSRLARSLKRLAGRHRLHLNASA